MKLIQGDIVLVPFPFSDQKSIKVRPALIISSRKLNERCRDVWITCISSQVTSSFNVDLNGNDLSVGTLLKKSYIKYSLILSIEKSLILKRVAHLKKEKLQEVLEKLQELLIQD